MPRETQNELEEAKGHEKLSAERLRRQGEESERIKLELDRTRSDVRELRQMLQKVEAQLT